MSSGFRAVQLFNLHVRCNGEPTPALVDVGFPASFRITMAAIDPTAKIQAHEDEEGASNFVGSTLRMLRLTEDSDEEDSDDEDDDEEDMAMADLLNGDDSEEDSEDGDPGPSDPSKSPKARRAAALLAMLENGVSDDEMDIDESLTKKDKGKGKMSDLELASDEDDEEDSDEDDFDDIESEQEFVLCTLDPAKLYQQTLDFTVNDNEIVYFSATGTHDIYLTGNILIPEEEGHDHDMFGSDDDSQDEDYDLEPDEDELGDFDEEDESDELDDTRITEVESEEEAAPALVKAKKEIKAEPVKGKNKRSHEDSELETPEKPAVDSKSKASDPTAAIDTSNMSKTQLKKLRKKMKDNAGNAVEPTAQTEEAKDAKETTPNKKVQFAKTLVQGPTGAAQTNGDAAKVKVDSKKAAEGVKAEKKTVADAAPKANGAAASKGERVVQGVTIDDRKLGSGPAAKKGDKVSMRYIGKLEKDKKVFDANKKGPPFTFKLGAGDVIKGWDIGILGMTVGGERRITVPAHLAYGSKSMAGIPANSTLVFDVKCLEIK